MSVWCSSCGHRLMLHFTPGGGVGPCQEDVGPDIEHLSPCPCDRAPEDETVVEVPA